MHRDGYASLVLGLAKSIRLRPTLSIACVILESRCRMALPFDESFIPYRARFQRRIVPVSVILY